MKRFLVTRERVIRDSMYFVAKNAAEARQMFDSTIPVAAGSNAIGDSVIVRFSKTKTELVEVLKTAPAE